MARVYLALLQGGKIKTAPADSLSEATAQAEYQYGKAAVRRVAPFSDKEYARMAGLVGKIVIA